MASISSKNITDGAAALALRNISRTALSLSPTHLLNSWKQGQGLLYCDNDETIKKTKALLVSMIGLHPAPASMHLWALDGQEVEPRLGRQGLGHQRLGAPRRPIQQNTLGRSDAWDGQTQDIHQPQRANIAQPPREWARTHPDERVGVSEGPRDRLLKLLLDVVLAPNVAP
jgi:hypothetical protein